MAEQPAGQRLFLVRLAIGLIQGLALYLLYHAQDAKLWPATSGMVFGPLLLVWLFIPLLVNQALGEMPWRRAALWAALATGVIALLGLYDIWAAWPLATGGTPQIIPSARLFIFCAAGLFIAHALVVGAAIDHRFSATYSTHFDTAWKMAVQLVLAILFVGAFWLLLWLGANLFSLIKLEFLRKLLQHEWFSIPAITLAAAGALHLTDVKPVLVRGVRTLGLTLLSWLLPLLTLIVAGFLVSLPFTGLAPLWAVGHASALLLAAAAVLIVLINAAHQDGDVERLPPTLLRWSGTLAAVLPLPLGAIAIYALHLRVNQYGWTEDRVLVAAALLVAGVEALGYARAAVTGGAWLRRIEGWNFVVALLVLAVLILLSTPLADPRRIAVADQMTRLNNGKTAPDKFDFAYLRWQGGRYGMQALDSLMQNKSADIRAMARSTRAQTNQYIPLTTAPAAFAARITVHPQGATLPPSFVATDWSKGDNKFQQPECAGAQVAHCDAVLADLDGDGRPEILLAQDSAINVQMFQDDGKGGWRLAATLALPAKCPAIAKAFREGRFALAPPAHRWGDIAVGGVTLRLSPSVDTPGCPK